MPPRPAGGLAGRGSPIGLYSLRTRLALLFFAITGAAVGIVYLYVVPQLESRLTADKLHRLERTALENRSDFRRDLAAADRDRPVRLRHLLAAVSAREDARVTILAARQAGGVASPAFVVADSESEATAAGPRYDVASVALATGRIASGVERIDGVRTGQAAVTVRARHADWVAVISTSLEDVESSVGLIQRQIVIAGLIALAAALIAGYWAARTISLRVRRVEQAAGRVAQGDFSHHVPVDSADELGQLAAAFNEMRERLERLDEARREFIANASHELRTPIFSLAGFAELLEDEELDPSTRAEFVGEMRQQLERMKQLASELLDLSKLDSGAIELKLGEVDLAELALKVVAEFKPAASTHDTTIEVLGPGGVTALADSDRVAQVLRILLDNALAHTPSGTRIFVTTADRGARAELAVLDDGPGIDAQAAKHVFDRFFTGSSRGSGLGLAIASELARLMGGEMRLASRSGRTEFALLLPLAKSARRSVPVA